MSDMDGYRDPICRECGADSCICPSDFDAPITCLHGKYTHDFCAECEVAGEAALAEMFLTMLRRVEGRQ